MKKTILPSANAAMPRRKFLQLSGMGAIGATLPLPSSLFRADAPNTATAKLAVQLYTVRNDIAKDFSGTLKRVRDTGFDTVETAFWPDGITVQQAGKMVKAAGFKVCSCHIELPVGEKKQAMLDTAAAFDCKRMIWHGWPEDKRYSSIDGTKELAGIYNESAKFAKEHGLQFGVHNHWWEYRNKVDGRFVYEVLLDELDKDIFFEIDTYWVKVAGQDPAKIVGMMGSRAQLLHIKDGPAIWNDNLPKNDEFEPMTAAGKGSQHFPDIVKAANGHTKFMVVEMDKTAGDTYVALKDSFDYLVNNKLARQ